MLCVAAKDAGLSGEPVLVVTPVAPPPVRDKQARGIAGCRPEGVQARTVGRPSPRANMNFPRPWRSLGGALGMFAKVELKCLLAATINRFEFESDGKRKKVVKEGLKAKP